MAGATKISAPTQPGPLKDALDDAARTYVALARALAARDPLSGGLEMLPEAAVQDASNAHRMPFAVIAAQARAASDSLPASSDAATAARRAGLVQHLGAVALRASQLDGQRVGLDQEMEGLFAVSPSAFPSDPIAAIHSELARLLPPGGSLADRFTRFEQRFYVPAERLPAVFDRAMAACRARTLSHVALPAAESLSIEYVKEAAWSGYSTYRGHYHSVVQVNTQYPQSVDRLLDLACHEGYPGHHTSSVLREQRLQQLGPGWAELSISPTFTPDSFRAEAAASQAPAVAFDEPARLALERDELFPIAGLDPATAARYVRVMRLAARLDGSIAAAIRGYLTDRLDFTETVWALQREALMAHPEALLMFVNRYRGYALAYVSGATPVSRAIRDGATVDELWERVVAPLGGDGQRPLAADPSTVLPTSQAITKTRSITKDTKLF